MFVLTHKVAITAMAAMVFALVPPGRQDPIDKPGAVSVPFEMLPSNHMVVELTLNDKGPYRLIFDLGAPVTLISTRAAKASDAVPKSARKSLFMGMQGEGRIRKLVMGDLEAKDLPVIVMDHPAVKALGQILGKPLDGIIGYTFWARYRTTIDYQAKILIFEPVDFEARDLMKDLQARMSGPRVAKTIILAPTAIWGLELEDEATGVESQGVAIRAVHPGSPAAVAGIRPGDTLVSIDGRWTTSVADAYAAVQNIKSGQPTPVNILRDQKPLTVEVLPIEGI
jgi:hypothetical protein